MLVIIFFIACNSLKQKEIFPLDENQRKEIISIEDEAQSGELKKKIISDSDLIKLKSKLSDLMKIQKPYLDSELNLIKLAELINMTPHQLSYIINTGFNENFFQYINTYRVEKAKELLDKEDMNKLSILGIAFESGFNSKTSFNTTFKKITGQTPSEFKKRSSVL
jgi:AraC-like DNA-binding protein